MTIYISDLKEYKEKQLAVFEAKKQAYLKRLQNKVFHAMLDCLWEGRALAYNLRKTDNPLFYSEIRTTPENLYDDTIVALADIKAHFESLGFKLDTRNGYLPLVFQPYYITTYKPQYKDVIYVEHEGLLWWRKETEIPTPTPATPLDEFVISLRAQYLHLSSYGASNEITESEVETLIKEKAKPNIRKHRWGFVIRVWDRRFLAVQKYVEEQPNITEELVDDYAYFYIAEDESSDRKDR